MPKTKAKLDGEPTYASRGEHLTYGLYFFGQLIFYILITNFLQLYLTNIGIPATAVGVLFIVAKVWDAINDPLFGVIVDKTHMKKGKYLPWIRLSTFLIPISTVLIFVIPSHLSVQVKTLLAGLAYLLWDTSYTLCDVPIYALATSMTSNTSERDKLYINSKIFVFLGGLLASISVPILYPAIGWGMTAIILAVLGIATMLPVGYKAKERFFTDDEHNPSIKELVGYLAKNKYLLVYFGALVVASLTNTGAPVQNYFAIHCLGSVSYVSILSLVSMIPMLIVVFFARRLIKKYEKKHLYIACLGGSALTGIVMYFTGYANFILLLAFITLRAIFGGMMVVLMAMFTADCAEYGNFKTGERAQGVAFSVQTFTAKVTAALSSAVCMLLLGVFGFVEGEGAVQSAATVLHIWQLYTLIPVIAAAAAMIILGIFYKLPQKDVALMVLCNKGELSRAEVISQLTKEY